MKSKNSCKIWMFAHRKKIIFLLVIIASGLACIKYITYSFKKWCQENQLEISYTASNLHWNHMGIPGLSFQNLVINNKNLNDSIKGAKADRASVQLYLLDFFKYYFSGYQIDLEINNLKIDLKTGNSMEADNIISDITCKNDTYYIKNFEIKPLRLKLTPESTTLKDDNSINSKGANLVIYKIMGNAEYFTQKSHLNLYVKIPPATSEMPNGKTYTFQAKGNLDFPQSPSQNNTSKDDPGIRGKTTLTVNNLSNLLEHLNQARIISSISKNIGTILGYPLPFFDVIVHKTEIFSDAVSVDLTFRHDGIYLGPFKL